MSVDVAALKTAQQNGLTVGVVPKPGGSPALRLEIDDLLQDADVANLYFLALEAFMNDTFQTDPLTGRKVTKPFSYFEISGIHGQPWRPWDNVTSADFSSTGQEPNPNSGYCCHGSVLFPTWHRAYLAQFEQALFLHAADIAPRLYGGLAQSVLDHFRIPYWDPLLPRQKLVNSEQYKYGIPIIFTLRQIRVRRPENPTEFVSMDNPLYRFDFPQDQDVQNSFNWAESFATSSIPNFDQVVTQNTVRGYDGTTESANHQWLVQTFDNLYNPTTGRSSPDAAAIWRILFQSPNYKTVSNHYNIDRRTYNFNSLEGFHDNIHTNLGAGPRSGNDTNPLGHMAFIEFAGFDPAFWLHHCNVDRLSAIWQAIHSHESDSTAWWDSEVHPDPTFVEPAGEKETPSTSLVPFRRYYDQQHNTVWWKSQDLRDCRNLGYDYPQIAAARGTGDVARGLRAWANDAVGWANPQSPGRPDDGARAHLKGQIKELIQSFPRPALMDGTTPLGSGEEYISSESIALQGVHSAIAKPAQGVLHMTAPSLSVHQAVLRTALPAQSPAFAERFGNLGQLVSEGKMLQWNVSFGVEKFALNGSFVIYFFLGDFNPEPSAWLHEPNLAGSSGIFASTHATIRAGGCDKCAEQEDRGARYYDTVPLTPALLTYYQRREASNGLGLTSLDPSTVVHFLTRNLHWRIVDVRGSHIARESVPSLKVAVYSETVRLPQDLTDAPHFEDEQLHVEITDGRPGGLNRGEQI